MGDRPQGSGNVRTRDGRSLNSIRDQLDRIYASTAGTDTYYRRFRQAQAIAQRYSQNIQNEINRRAASNPNSMGNRTLSMYQRDAQRERNALFSRNVYDPSVRAQTAAMGNSSH